MSFFTAIKITDGTNIAAVKPASTPAIATDPALVVAISPNNSLTFSGTQAANSAAQTAAWTSGTTLNTALTLSLVGYANAEVSINYTGSITGGVIFFEVNDGNGWVPITMANITAIGSSGTNYTLASSAGAQAWQMFVGGFTQFRVRLSTVISGSGTLNISTQGSVFPAEPLVDCQLFGLTAQGNAVAVKVNPSGALTTASTITGNNGGILDAASSQNVAAPNSGLLVLGEFNTTPTPISTGNVSPLQLDTNGNLLVNVKTGSETTRPASPTTANWLQAPINVSASGANVIVAGVGGQTVRIMRMFFVNSDPTTVTNVTIQDTTPTSFSGAFRLITGGSFNGADSNGEPLYVSAVGKGIQLNSSAAVQLSGTVWYTQS